MYKFKYFPHNNNNRSHGLYIVITVLKGMKCIYTLKKESLQILKPNKSKKKSFTPTYFSFAPTVLKF